MLLKSDNDLKKYFINRSSTLGLKDIQPMIENFVSPYLKNEILGEATYSQLNDSYNNDVTQLNPSKKALLELCQNFIVNETFLRSVGTLNILIGKGGFTVSLAEGVAPASQARTEDLKKTLAQLSAEAEENILRYLEKNKNDFEDWKNSELYTGMHDCLLYSATVFNEVMRIAESRRFYKTVKPLILQHERKAKQLIGDEMYQRLIEKIKAGDPTPKQKELIYLLRCGLSRLVMGDALIELPVQITIRGAVLLSTSDRDNTVVETQLTDEEKASKKKHYVTSGNDYLSEAKKIINKNVDEIDFDQYKGSSADNSKAEIRTGIIGDGDTKGAVMM